MVTKKSCSNRQFLNILAIHGANLRKYLLIATLLFLRFSGVLIWSYIYCDNKNEEMFLRDLSYNKLLWNKDFSYGKSVHMKSVRMIVTAIKFQSKCVEFTRGISDEVAHFRYMVKPISQYKYIKHCLVYSTYYKILNVPYFPT